MATITHDNLWLCDECTIAAVNDDYTGLDYHYDEKEAAERMEAIQQGLTKLGWLSANYDPETGDGCDDFSSNSCDCCKTRLAGSRTRFAILA